jgi:hypothetical protein
MRIVPWLAAGALALAVGCASSTTSSPSGTATAPHPAVGGAMANVSGAIQNYTTGPSGQQNGFALSSGQRVQFPEAMGSKVSDQFPPNTQVEVSGHMATDSSGRPVLEADRITDKSRNATLDLTAARAAPPSPASGPTMGGSGTAGTEPMNPPVQTQPSTGMTPPPGGR